MPKAGSRGGAQTAKSALEADYLSVSLGNPEMIKRLKVVTELLEAYGDDDQSVEKAKSEVGQLASTLGEDWLIEHKSKDVRLLAACALADILRLYAPEPPYSDECSADIIRLFIKIIRGFESPDMTTNHPSYRVHFYLLERLSNISIFSIIPDLLHFREALMLELTNASYAVVGNMPQHESTQKIADHLTSILCAVLEETESHDIEIFDKVVGALCQEEKRTNPAGHAMMKQVIASCENKFQPYVERQLHQVKAGFLMESELSNADRLEEAVFELCTCAPRVLTQVLPAYTEDLTVDEPERRIKAIKLLGAIFSVGTFRSDFGQVFAEFKRRTGDKDVDVRKAMISVMHHLILKRPELAPGFIQESYIVAGEDREAPFMRLIIDGDEGVRKQAIISGVDICLHHAEAVPLAFLEQVGGRVRDKKESVRRAAAEGLAKLWHKHCAPFDLDDLTPSIANRFGWIPSKIVGLTNMDQAAKNLAEHCIDLCLASSPVPRGAPSVALDFYSSLDAPEASEHLEKLEKTNVAKVWEILEGMVRKPGNAAAVKKQQDDILKRLGPRSPLLDFVKQLVAALVDPHFGFDFVNHVFTGISAKNSAEVARAKGGLRLLPALADVNPALFASQEAALEKMVLQQDDKGMAEHFLATLAACAGSMPALYKNRKLLAGLEANCAQSSWTVAKHAARTMVALGQTQFDKLVDSCTRVWGSMVALGPTQFDKIVDSCTRNLTLGPRLPAVLRVLLEIAKAAPDEVMGEREAIQGFVLKKLLHTAWPNAAGKKSDKSIATEARAHGLKLLATLLIHAGPDAPGMRDKVLGAFIDTILQGGEMGKAGVPLGGEMGKEAGVPRADKATLRLVAGSCILRVATLRLDAGSCILRVVNSDSLNPNPETPHPKP
ncbi:armadillo-type protein [Baffinella frigidus]|nr:armadillo-type protein [Cryptophyta sp. CCMP2293]